MTRHDDNLFYTCSLIELIGRTARQKRKDVVTLMGEKIISHIYHHADTLHCEPIAKIADYYIDFCHIPTGNFDNVSSCKYAIPSYWDIGKVYARLIEDILRDDVIAALFQVYNSPVSDSISYYNSDFYYQPRGFIKEQFLSEENADAGKTSKKPAIRFRGFTDPWEQRKLGELLQTLPFKPYLKEPEQDGKYAIIQQGNDPIIGFANGLPCDDYQDTVIFGDHTLSLYKPKQPFFVATDGVRIVKGTQKTDGFYLLSLLERYMPQSEGYKRYYGILSDTECYYTDNTDEQRQIGTYFKQLDDLITLHQRKYDKLVKIKKSMLEKLFPKNDSKFPEIRFSGFTAPWEQRKLGEIADKVSEKNNTRLFSETFTNSAENGIISQQDYFDHAISNEANLDGYYVVREEDFVYNPRISVTAPVGPINRNKLRRVGVISPLYTVFRTHNIDNTFLEYFFKSVYWHSYMNFNGDSGARADRFSIKNSVFFEMPIPYPEDREQTKIGSYLTGLDRLITLHQRKLEKLKKIKKSCLEKMFA